MKKIICAFLLVTMLCSLVGCSVSSTKQYDELVVEHNNLQARNDTLKAEYKDLAAKYDEITAKYYLIEAEYAELTEKYEALDTLYNDYVALTESQMVKNDIGFELLGKTMSDEALTAVMGDVVVMTLPYVSPDESLEILGDSATLFGLTMSSNDYKSCLLLFVDDNGDCQIGFNIIKNGGITYFRKQN